MQSSAFAATVLFPRAAADSLLVDRCAQPPVGACLREPALAVNASREHGLVDVTVDLGAAPTDAAPDGHVVGPTIRAARGDVVVVRFSAAAPRSATAPPPSVTVHGLHPAPDHGALATFVRRRLSLAPGERAYGQDLWFQPAGTFPLYAVQEGRGGGPGRCPTLGVIDLADDPAVRLGAFETKLAILGAFTVNGMVNPYEPARPGQVKRFRIVNASATRDHHIALEGHALHVIGDDEGLFEGVRAVRELVLAPGAHADVLVKVGSRRGEHRLTSRPARGAARASPTTLLTLRVEGAALRQELPAVVNPYAAPTSRRA